MIVDIYCDQFVCLTLYILMFVKPWDISLRCRDATARKGYHPKPVTSGIKILCSSNASCEQCLFVWQVRAWDHVSHKIVEVDLNPAKVQSQGYQSRRQLFKRDCPMSGHGFQRTPLKCWTAKSLHLRVSLSRLKSVLYVSQHVPNAECLPDKVCKIWIFIRNSLCNRYKHQPSLWIEQVKVRYPNKAGHLRDSDLLLIRVDDGWAASRQLTIHRPSSFLHYVLIGKNYLVLALDPSELQISSSSSSATLLEMKKFLRHKAIDFTESHACLVI